MIRVQSKVRGSYPNNDRSALCYFPMRALKKEKSNARERTYNTKASGVAKYLVHDHVVGCDPADPVEVGQALGDETREPIPAEASSKDIEEVPVSADTPSVGLARIGCLVVVKCVHQCGVGQCLRPDHGGRPDQEAPDDTGHAKPNTLGGEHEQHLEAPAKALLVVDLLGKKHVGSVRDTALDGDIGHHDNDGMLLDIEGAWVQVPLESKGVEFVIGQDLDESCQSVFFFFPHQFARVAGARKLRASVAYAS